MIKCQVCGADGARVIPLEYHVEDFSGVRVGIVDCVEKTVCDACGEEVITIPDVNGLIAAAAVVRAMSPVKLNGAEVRFLRKAIGMGAKQLASKLGVRAETVSRWENDPKMRISDEGEKLLRIMVGNHLKGLFEGKEDVAPGVDYNEEAVFDMEINPLRAVDESPFCDFVRGKVTKKKRTQDGWEEKPLNRVVNF